MAPHGGLWQGFSKLRKTSKPNSKTREFKIVYPFRERLENGLDGADLVPCKFTRPGNRDVAVTADPNESDTDGSLVSLARHVKRGSVPAITSVNDAKIFIKRGKDRVDAYTETTKAFMDDIGARINKGEDLPCERMIDELVERCLQFAQSQVKEVLTAINPPTKLFEHPTKLLEHPTDDLLPPPNTIKSSTKQDKRTSDAFDLSLPTASNSSIYLLQNPTPSAASTPPQESISSFSPCYESGGAEALRAMVSDSSHFIAVLCFV
jgi:hypothetical protein